MQSLQPLRAFLKAAELRSFSSAARALGLTSSAIAKSVARLEAELGVRLLHRTTRSVRLSDEGVLFFEHCRALMTEADLAVAALSKRHDVPSGTLRASLPIGLGRQVVAPQLATFQRRAPKVTVQLSLSDRRVNLIEEGFDVAVRVGVPNDRSLVARRLGVQQIITVAPPALVASRRLETVGDLLGLPAVNFVSPNSNRQRPWTFSSGRRQLEWVPPQPVLLDDGDGVVAAAASGLGITQAPTYLCSDALARGQLVEVLPALRPAAEPLFAVFPSRRDVPARVRAFVDFLVEAFGASSAGRERAEHGEGPE
ncbi:MAG: LysR family transcriptional regulator [Myxococcaceae bacterium]